MGFVGSETILNQQSVDNQLSSNEILKQERIGTNTYSPSIDMSYMGFKSNRDNSVMSMLTPMLMSGIAGVEEDFDGEDNYNEEEDYKTKTCAKHTKHYNDENNMNDSGNYNNTVQQRAESKEEQYQKIDKQQRQLQSNHNKVVTNTTTHGQLSKPIIPNHQHNADDNWLEEEFDD